MMHSWKRDVAWCLIGVGLGSILWGVVHRNSLRGAVADSVLTERERASIVRMNDVSLNWLMGTCRVWQTSNYQVIIPTERNRAAFVIRCRKESPFPIVLFSDDHTNGRPSRVFVFDSKDDGVRLTDLNGDGAFNSLSYNAGAGTVTLFDDDLDGQIDGSVGSNNVVKLRVGEQLYELQKQDGTTCVRTPTGLKRIVKKNGELFFYTNSNDTETYRGHP